MGLLFSLKGVLCGLVSDNNDVLSNIYSHVVELHLSIYSSVDVTWESNVGMVYAIFIYYFNCYLCVEDQELVSAQHA